MSFVASHLQLVDFQCSQLIPASGSGHWQSSTTLFAANFIFNFAVCEKNPTEDITCCLFCLFAHMNLCVFHDRVESVWRSGEQHSEKTSTMQQFRFYKSETGLDLTLCCCIHQMNVYFLHPQQHEPLLGSTSDDSTLQNTPALSLLTWIKMLTPLHFLHTSIVLPLRCVGGGTNGTEYRSCAS